MKHIVDTLIEERAQKLQQHPYVWKYVQKYLYPVLGYQQTIKLIDDVQGLSGYAVFEHLSNLLSMQVTVQGIEHLPKKGRAVLMPNHPAGIADGIAVFDAVKSIRPDLTFFANRDAVRCQENLTEIVQGNSIDSSMQPRENTQTWQQRKVQEDYVLRVRRGMAGRDGSCHDGSGAVRTQTH